MVESPEPSIGQYAPIQAAMLYIKGNLIRWVFIREGITALTFERNIQLTIPGLRIANSNRRTR